MSARAELRLETVQERLLANPSGSGLGARALDDGRWVRTPVHLDHQVAPQVEKRLRQRRGGVVLHARYEERPRLAQAHCGSRAFAAEFSRDGQKFTISGERRNLDDLDAVSFCLRLRRR